jgi:hypothetical protein
MTKHLQVRMLALLVQEQVKVLLGQVQEQVKVLLGQVQEQVLQDLVLQERVQG